MAKTNSSVPAFGMRDKLGYMFGDFGNDGRERSRKRTGTDAGRGICPAGHHGGTDEAEGTEAMGGTDEAETGGEDGTEDGSEDGESGGKENG